MRWRMWWERVSPTWPAEPSDVFSRWSGSDHFRSVSGSSLARWASEAWPSALSTRSRRGAASALVRRCRAATVSPRASFAVSCDACQTVTRPGLRADESLLACRSRAGDPGLAGDPGRLAPGGRPGRQFGAVQRAPRPRHAIHQAVQLLHHPEQPGGARGGGEPGAGPAQGWSVLARGEARFVDRHRHHGHRLRAAAVRAGAALGAQRVGQRGVPLRVARLDAGGLGLLRASVENHLDGRRMGIRLARHLDRLHPGARGADGGGIPTRFSMSACWATAASPSMSA